MSSTLGKIVAGLVVLFLAIAGYEFLIKGSSPATNTTSPSGIVTENFAGTSAGDNQDFLRVLGNLENVSLDGSLLSSDAFASLVDFSVELSDQPKGRVNPFKSINPSEPDLVSAGVPGALPVPAATSTQ